MTDKRARLKRAMKAVVRAATSPAAVNAMTILAIVIKIAMEIDRFKRSRVNTQ